MVGEVILVLEGGVLQGGGRRGGGAGGGGGDGDFAGVDCIFVEGSLKKGVADRVARGDLRRGGYMRFTRAGSEFKPADWMRGR